VFFFFFLMGASPPLPLRVNLPHVYDVFIPSFPSLCADFNPYFPFSPLFGAAVYATLFLGDKSGAQCDVPCSICGAPHFFFVSCFIINDIVKLLKPFFWWFFLPLDFPFRISSSSYGLGLGVTSGPP
jgi:hypothetical protein